MDVPVKSVKKALDLLTLLLFECPDGASLTELAKKTQSPNNSTHNLLKTMGACGYVEQLEGSRYAPGPRCREIGFINRFQLEKSGDVNRILNDLAEELQEPTVLTVLAGGRRLTVGRGDVQVAVKIDHAIVEDQSIYSLPTGRILVTYADERELDAIVERYGFPGERWDDAESLDELKRLRAAIREDGHCVMEQPSGVVAFAVPAEGNDVVGALGAYAPVFRCPKSRQKNLLKALKSRAEELSHNL